MSIIVSGASGHLGRRVSELLLEQVNPAELVLVTRSPEKLADLAARGAQIRHGDLDDPRGIVGAYQGGDRLLLISIEPASKVPQHRSAIEAAKAAGVGFVAYTSFMNPVKENPAGIAGEHRETERMLAASGLGWAVLRNSMYAESQVHDAETAIAHGILVHNTGQGRVSYVSRDDCAAAAAAVVAGGDHHGRHYDVTGPEALVAEQLAGIYGELGRREVSTVEIDDAALTAALIDDGVPAPTAALLASFGVSAREGYLDTVSTCVADLTGRAPRTLRDVLREQRDQFAAAGTESA